MNPFGNRKRVYSAAGALMALSIGGGVYSALHTQDLHIVGTVDAHQVVLAPQVTGRIASLLVTEGQEVKAGEVVAVLDGRELSAGIDSSRAQVRSLEGQFQAARAMAMSTAGEVSNGIDNAKAALDMAQATYAEAVANRRRQETTTLRVIALTQKGAMTLQDQDTAQRNLEALEARERTALNGVQQAKASLKAAVARAHQGRAAEETAASVEGRLLAARAQATEAETRLDHTRIIAPVSGRIDTVVAREGEVVNAGAPVVTLTDLAQTWVFASLPETDAEGVGVGDTLRVRMPGGTWLRGTLIAKATEAEFATQRDVSDEKRDIRTIRMKIAIPNPGGRFVPGMTAETIVPAALRGRR